MKKKTVMEFSLPWNATYNLICAILLGMLGVFQANAGQLGWAAFDLILGYFNFAVYRRIRLIEKDLS